MTRSKSDPLHAPEIWAGVECTVNRVGDEFRHQCRKNGHYDRISDLSLFADLGIKRLRYPFLWELAWREDGQTNWRWADERTGELLRLGIRPIAGFLHHGSGPPDTHLLDPAFPEKLAAYARAFAERYPWIEEYTPVNEPLTTARFSALYGIWYPHAQSDSSFVRSLYHQIKATILAMDAIRGIQPTAKLVQTEDLGKAQGTSPLSYQVRFENLRRWLTFDLLTGRVDRLHPLYVYLRKSGLSEGELKWIEENACPPDIIGINHYPLSNRFLDHELKHYPGCFHGGNGRHRYADVGAVDSPRARPIPPKDIFRGAWERYRIPVAVTEAHIHGPRESQLRWFHEIWNSCVELRAEGADLRAVTAWSLLGSYDWNSLCTLDQSFYESGVFDARAKPIRPTALAKMIKSLATSRSFSHPVLEQPGYWRRAPRASTGGKRILITGATGTLGRAFARVCEERHIPYRLLTRADMDIASPEKVKEVLESTSPWAVINAAGYVKVDEAEAEEERCFRENVAGPETLARETNLRGIPLLSFSTDMVFNGEIAAPYRESHPVSPLNVYGRSKAESESRVLGQNDRALVVRTSSFFGPWDEYNFVTILLRRLRLGETVEVASDLTISPTYVPDLVNGCLDLLIDGERGIVHLTNKGSITWTDFGRQAEALAHAFFDKGAFSGRIHSRPVSELKLKAPRPRYSALSTERFEILPTFENALERYFIDFTNHQRAMEVAV